MDKSYYEKVLIVAAVYASRKRRKAEAAAVANKKRTRRWWVRPIFEAHQRQQQGAHHNLIKEMRLTDHKLFSNYMRMSPQAYDKLLSIVGPLITKKYVVREPLDPGTKLELTLR